MTVRAVRWVGGFGEMDWVDATPTAAVSSTPCCRTATVSPPT